MFVVYSHSTAMLGAGATDSAASSAADSGAGGGSADGEERDEAETPPRPQRNKQHGAAEV
jgi:hypothetical protein